jgi:tetratricopeptide (TPR) repeat protein
MISHIYHALGDWEASERANVLADAVVDRQRASSGLAPNSCGHYNEWLVYARLQLGKDASDIVSGCRSQAEAHIARGAADRLGFGAASSYAAIAAWQGVDTGVWPDRIDEGTGEGFLLARMMLAHARALQYRDDPQTVETALGELQAVADAFALVLPQVAPDDRTSVAWAQRAVAQVDAIRMIAAGERDAGLIALRAAAEAESALPVVFGPPNIAKPSWEVLGEELLALGRQQEAAEAFRRSLQFAPNRKLSNAGLAAATGG